MVILDGGGGVKPNATAFTVTHRATQRPIKSPLDEDMWLSYMCVTLQPHNNMEDIVSAKAVHVQLVVLL